MAKGRPRRNPALGPDDQEAVTPQEKKILHSSQLDERFRRADPPDATPADRRRRAGLLLLMVGTFIVIVAVLLGNLGIGIDLTTEVQVYLLGAAALALMGASFLFNSIRWHALRGKLGQRVLDKARGEFLLTTVSIVALFTVVVMVVVEFLALLVFLDLVDFGVAGARFAAHFVLFQAIMLLVYLMALVARESHPSIYRPSEKARVAATALSPVAAFSILLGALLATGVPQRFGVLAALEPAQAVYVVTLGVLLEFMAMRIRLRLPSIVSLFRSAVEVSRRANTEMRQELKKRAVATYFIALFFVVGSMAFAGAVATGTVTAGGRVALSLVIFYVGFALILLGLIAVRIIQTQQLRRQERVRDEGVEVLLDMKRRSPEATFRLSVYVLTGLMAATALVVAVLTFMERLPWHSRYYTDFGLLAVLLGAGPYGFFFTRELKRIESIDEKFPDFLRDLAESARAGMTLPRALVTAAHGTYGALTDEVRMMAAQVEWGVAFSDALERFAKRANTPLIDRTVSLVVEAQRAGGNVVDILTAAAEDAREIKQIVNERNEQMSLYKVVVYIAFFVFIAVVLILSAQFIPAFDEAVQATGGGAQVGGIRLSEFDPEDFNTLFFHAAIVQAIGGGLVGGVLTRGRPVAGFGSIAVMLAVSWLSFRVLVGVIS